MSVIAAQDFTWPGGKMMTNRSSINAVSIVLIIAGLGSVLCCSNEVAPWSDAYNQGLWPGLEPGPFAVGYKVDHRYDSERSFPGTPDGKRPIQISIWYPAASAGGHLPITWKDYFLSAATEIDFSAPDSARRIQHLEGMRALALEAGADGDRLQHLLELNTTAYRDLMVAEGHFPLVVFVPGRGAPAFQNTIAYEYLASNGFVVASFPSFGADSRDMTRDEAGATAQVRDIELVIKVASELAPVDPESVAIIGYSWGGLTATLAAMSGIEIDALVSIDSTLMVKKGHALALSFKDYNPDALQMPVMLVIAAALQWKEQDVSFFDELPGKHASLLRFHDLKHGDFGSVIIRFFVHTRRGGGGRDVERVDLGYATVCRYLLAFLDAHLRGSEKGKTFLAAEPANNGIPTGVVSIERR